MKRSKPLKSASLSPWMEVEEGMLLVIPRNHRRGHAPGPLPRPSGAVAAGGGLRRIGGLDHGALFCWHGSGNTAQNDRNTGPI